MSSCNLQSMTFTRIAFQAKVVTWGPEQSRFNVSESTQKTNKTEMSGGDRIATFHCAGCGVEVSMDWTSPCFGLCERCEETVIAAETSWRPKSGDKHDTEPRID